jgi:hypothetical protein
MSQKAMKLQMLTVTSALVLIAPPVIAAEITGHNTDLQVLSDTTVVFPDQPGHQVKQLVVEWKTDGSDPDWKNVKARAVAQQDITGQTFTIRGYGMNVHPSGDMDYFKWQGAGRLNDKGEGEEQGQITGASGTGKFKDATGKGTYTCQFSAKGTQCDWKAEIETVAASH